MITIKKSLIATFAVISLAGTALAGIGWETSIEAGIAKAKQTNKSVMVEFTGSDWCPPCMMMEKQVFSQAEFVSKASEKYVLVIIDIPKKNPTLKAKNQKVMGKYGVRGVPTILLMDSEGKEFSRFTASQFPAVDKFLAHLDSALEKKDME